MAALATVEELAETKMKIKRIVKQNIRKRPKPRIKAPSILDTIFHSRNQKSTVKYFTCGRKFDTEKKLPSYMRPTNRGRLIGNILSRVHIPEEKFEVSCVTDVDQEFYTVVRGRPLRQKFNLRDYRQEIKRRLKTNIKVGFLKDVQNLQIEQGIAAQTVVEKLNYESNKVVDSLQTFMAEDFKRTTDLERKYKRIEMYSDRMKAKLAEGQKKMSNQKIHLKKLNNELDEALKLQDFLFNLSPTKWQKEYQKKKEKRVELIKPEVEELKNRLKFYKEHCGGWEPVVEEIVTNFINVFASVGPVDIYFKDPRDIIYVLREIELKNLNLMMDNQFLESELKEITDLKDKIKNFWNCEVKRIRTTMSSVKENVVEEKKRLEDSKAMTEDLARGRFYDLVTSDKNLRIKGLIKNLYDSIFAYGPKELSTIDMLEKIDGAFTELFWKLKDVPMAVIRKKLNDIQKAKNMEMNKALKARLREIQLEQTVEGLKKAVLKPYIPFGKPLVFRSAPIEKKYEGEEEEEKPTTPTYIGELTRELKLYHPLTTEGDLLDEIPQEVREYDCTAFDDELD